MAMKPWKKKLVIFGVLLGILAIPFAWWGGKYFWYHGFSHGSRHGILRKMSVKGHPGCRFLSGELVVQGNTAGLSPDIWTFSVDDDRDSNPIVQKLKEAENSGKPVTLDYRQDEGNKDKLWVCEEQPEYYVTNVETSGK